MIRNVQTRKSGVFCLFFIVLAAVSALGGAGATPLKPELPEIVKLRQRVSAAAANQRAAEAYEQKETEVAPWTEDAWPSKPNNAALLYYQAFLLRPEPNMAINQKIHDLFFDAEPDGQIRIYLGHCLPMIEMVEIASRMPQCAWGIWPGHELRQLSEEVLHSQVSYLWQILLVDARTLAADGHYRAALDRCLTARRFAHHLCEDPRLYLIARNPDFMALRTIRHVLSAMPPDAETLRWFRGQLAVVQGIPLSFAEMLRADVQAGLNHLQTYPPSLRYFKTALVDMATDEQAKQSVRDLTDEKLLLRINQELTRFVDSIFCILDSSMTYEQKLTQMQRLVSQQREGNGNDSVIKAILLSGMNMGIGGIDRQYPFLVGHQAHINGIKAAVEVYLVVAQTGQLPEKLPEHLPKDPFTGRDFVYEITDEGFALRCQGEEFLRRKNQFLEFKVRR